MMGSPARGFDRFDFQVRSLKGKRRHVQRNAILLDFLRKRIGNSMCLKNKERTEKRPNETKEEKKEAKKE